MNPKTGELILADIALCIETIDKVMWRAETEPLTPKTISKRHVRILMMLSASSTMENNWVHADLEQIREIVAMRSNKLYPKIDIQSFTFDLVNRGYVDHKVDEEHGDVFAILPEGVHLLEIVKENLPPHINESSTPNSYVGIRH